MQAIVICTTPTPSPWLPNLLNSLDGYDKYPVIIVSNYGYEVGKIRWVVENTTIDEFVLLHDSCEIKDTRLFDLCFKEVGYTVMFDPKFRSYMGKWRREVLERIGIPRTDTKEGSVSYEESWANKIYLGNERKKKVLFKEGFSRSSIFEEKFGRNNMVLSNKYIKKWKGTWQRQQLRRG